MARWPHITALVRSVGFAAAASILAARCLGVNRALRVRAGEAKHLVHVRPMESDLFVLGQIFGSEEYAFPDEVMEGLRRRIASWSKKGITPIIVDGGANVGFSALYFSHTFPDCMILAVEPDPETFKWLEQNCRGEERIACRRVALWSHENGVDFSQSENGSWANRIIGEHGLTPSIRLERLLAEVPTSRLLLLKLDVEGGEREICQASPLTVASASCIAIEPHDFLLPGHGSLAPLFAALAGKKVDTLISGENLLIYDSDLLETGQAKKEML